MTERVVWKYTLEPDRVTTIEGGDPRVVHVDVDPASYLNVALAQSNLPTVWVELEPGGVGVILLTFVGTGHPVPEDFDMTHVGSCVTPAGLVWHVYGR